MKAVFLFILKNEDVRQIIERKHVRQMTSKGDGGDVAFDVFVYGSIFTFDEKKNQIPPSIRPSKVDHLTNKEQLFKHLLDYPIQ